MPTFRNKSIEKGTGNEQSTFDVRLTSCCAVPSAVVTNQEVLEVEYI